MRSLKLFFILLILFPLICQAQVGNPPVQLKNNGTALGGVLSLNCTGTLTCTKSGSAGTLNATGGTSVNLVQATVDFGTPYEDGVASVTVTGQAWVTGTSKILCTPDNTVGTADHVAGDDDVVLERIVVTVSSLVAGTGFTISAASGSDTGSTQGKYTINCSGI